MQQDKNSNFIALGIMLIAAILISSFMVFPNEPISGQAAQALAACTNANTCGDVNCDGYTDVLDAQLIAQHSAGTVVITNLDRADANGNGAVDVSDALSVAQFSGGMLRSLNCNSPVQPARLRGSGATQCSSNAQCNYPNEVCANGLCQSCYQDSQCGAGFTCDNGVCRIPSLPPQAATIQEACKDGVDNDNDGRVDHSSINSINPDPHCQNAEDNLEEYSFDNTVNRIWFNNYHSRTNLPVYNRYFSNQGYQESAMLTFSYNHPTLTVPSNIYLPNGMQGLEYLGSSSSLLQRTNSYGRMTGIHSILYVGGNKIERVRSSSGPIAGPDLYIITRDSRQRITDVSNLRISNAQYYLYTDRLDSIRVGTGGNAKDYRFTYNFNNKLRSVQIDHRGTSVTTTYDYDSNNRLRRARSPGSTINIVRFTDGRVSRIEGNFGTMWFNYDSQDRLTEIHNAQYEVLSDIGISRDLLSGPNFEVPVLDLVWLNEICSERGLMGSLLSFYNVYRNQAAPSTEQARLLTDLACRNIQ